MIQSCLFALLSHWWRNPLQLFTFLAGLALATALWSGVQAINAEARASYDAAAATLGEGQFDQMVPRQGDSVAQADYIMLRRAGWLVSPVLDGTLEGVRIVGVDPVTSPMQLAMLTNGDGPDAFAFGQENRLFANAETASLFTNELQITIDAGVAPGVAIGDIGTVQRLLNREDLSRLIMLPQQPRNQPALTSIAPHLRLQPSQQVADVAQLTDSFHLNLTAFGLLSFAVGLFIVHSTIGLAFEQRRAMVRTLRAMGVPLVLVIAVITVEMLALGTIGALFGIILGYLIAGALLPDVAATLQGLYGARISGTLALRPEWWLSGLGLALLGTIVSVTGRLWQIAKMPVLASARPRAWVMSGAGRFRFQTGLAALLLTAACGLALVGDGLIAAFALLGCLLIGAALALPLIAERLLARLQSRSGGPVRDWFWADTRQQLPGLSLALMALLLAISANIGVSTMVSSFRLTFVGFLDQRLAPELFVRVDSADQSAALEAYTVRIGMETLPLRSTEIQMLGQPVRLFGVRVGPTYRDNWAFLAEQADAWDKVDAGNAVVVNEQLARKSELWIGDAVQVAPDRILPIAAVVGDYGNPQGQVVISEDLFASLHPDVYARQFGLRTQDPDALKNALRSDLGLLESAMVDQAALKSMSLNVFERTFVVTSALNVLTLGVAGFAILMSLLTLADLRVPQLAPVWALGLTRKHLGWLELLRAVALAVVVFVLALPLGLALAWILLSIVNVEAFGWRLPMFLFPGEYSVLGLYAVLAAVLAAAWPSLRLMRTPASHLLKVFSHER